MLGKAQSRSRSQRAFEIGRRALRWRAGIGRRRATCYAAGAMLHLNDVTLRIGGRLLLEQASVHLPAGHRIGLVGAQRQRQDLAAAPDPGRADAGCRRGAPAPQRGGRLGRAGGAGRRAHAARGGARCRSRARPAPRAAETAVEPAAIAEIQTRLADIGAHAAPARASAILAGLGFDEAAQQQPLSGFSGGWRMRVALAAVLFAEPDLLLLDEPTNHLDLEASLWLEDYLRRYPKTLLLVSHDRELLNRVPERIVHLDQRKLTCYAGGYDAFERNRREKLTLQAKERARSRRSASTCRRSSTASATRRAKRARRKAGSRRSRSSSRSRR